METALFIAHVSSVSVLIPLVLAIIQWGKLPKEIAIIRWILVFSLILDLTAFLFVRFSINTHPLGNAYLFIQFACLFYIFSFYNQRKKLLVLVFGIFTVFYLVNIAFIQGPKEFNTNANVIASLILIVLSLNFLFSLLNELSVIHIHRLPILWISFAALLYYAATLFIFLASNLFFQSEDQSGLTVWILHNFLNIIKNMLFAVGLWQNFRAQK